MPKISPFLWFVGNMQEAVNFYVSVFEDARVIDMSPMSARFDNHTRNRDELRYGC